MVVDHQDTYSAILLLEHGMPPSDESPKGVAFRERTVL
jgi:hypothetical protein